MEGKGLIYKCLECDKVEIVKRNDHKIDGRVCKSCGGKLTPTGYIVGIDLAKGKDMTVYTPPIKINAN